MNDPKTIRVIMAEFSDVRFDARVRKSAQALANAGYHVDLLLYNASIQKDACRTEGNLVYHEYAFPGRRKTGSFFARFSRLVRAAVIMLQMNGWILTHRADVYHAHNLYYLWASVLASKYFKAKVVYDAHELHSESHDTGKFSGRFFNRMNEIYERILIPQCSAFIQACDARAEYIAGKYNIQKPYVINNHVPTVPYIGPTDRIQRECKLPPGTVILFYAGGVYADGGRRIDMVIAALQQLPEIHFVLVGFMNEDIRQQLLEKARSISAEDRVHILPPCAPHELYEYGASADIGVIPLAGNSRNVYMSALNKVSEYLMAGLPIACSDYPNLDSIVRENPVGPVGETFDVMSPDSIARAILSILDRRDKEKFRENALQLARSSLNWEHEERTLLGIYQKVCEG